MPEPLAVPPDSYLDARRPAWRAHETAGRVRATRHLVYVENAPEVQLGLALRNPCYASGAYAPVGLAVALFDGVVTDVRPGALCAAEAGG